jgi:GT2 family glycosyltransferase
VNLPVDVLVPTYCRPAALAVTLAGLTAQTLPRFRVVISDQSPDGESTAAAELMTSVRLLRARGRPVELLRHGRHGLAEHRQFLLDQASAPYALFLDDDVLCEPEVLARLLRVIREEACGFVGAPLVGLSHLDDVRVDEQVVEPWIGAVCPEPFGPDDERWQRHRLHNAANVWHVEHALQATDAEPLVYKVAWVGGCVLYDVGKLRSVGGFGFWRDLPAEHCGEDVLVQQRLRERYGGCGVLPSGAYHQQLPTTVPDRRVDAPVALATVPRSSRALS